MEQLDGKELAKCVADSLNSYNFSNDEFIKQMKYEHRTLQQNFMRLIRAYILNTARLEKWEYDGRNEASVEACKLLSKCIEDNDIRLPFI